MNSYVFVNEENEKFACHLLIKVKMRKTYIKK